MRSMRNGMAVVLSAAAVWFAEPAAAQDDKATEVIAASRQAMGGQKVEAVKTISASGEYRRVFGEREVNGEATIEIIAPDKIKRTE